MVYEFYGDIPQDFEPVISRLREDGVIPSTECLEHPLSDEALYLLKILARKGII